MVVNAKDFCAQTGWPLKTIRRMCRAGQLEHWRQGRMYLLDMEATLVRLELFKDTPCPPQVAELPRQRHNKVVSLSGANSFDGYTSRTERMRARLLGKEKKDAGTGTSGNPK